MISVGTENGVACYRIEESDICKHWTRTKRGRFSGSIRTGDKLLDGTVKDIRKNDCFSSFIDLQKDSGELETILVS